MANIFQRRIFWVALVLIMTVGLAWAQIAGGIVWVGDFTGIEQATSTARKLKANEAQLAIPANGPVVSHPTNSGVSQPLWTAPQSPAIAPSQTPVTVPLHPLPQPGGQHSNGKNDADQ